MRIKLWIIYRNGIGFSKMVAEMLQDHFEDYIEVNVGKLSKIDPEYIIEENVDFLILGDIICEKPTILELKNWILSYINLLNLKDKKIKYISGFFVTPSDFMIKPVWIDILREYIGEKLMFPPILHLNLNREEFKLENNASDMINEYCNEFIEFILNLNE
jgi:hypothetical protein